MAVEVFSKSRQPLHRLFAKATSVAGDGILERAQAISFVLLGLAAALALALVAYVAHQSWPVIPDIPIPGLPAEHSAVHGAVIVARPPGPALRGGATRGHLEKEGLSLAAAGGRAASGRTRSPAAHGAVTLSRPAAGAGAGRPHGRPPPSAPAAPPAASPPPTAAPAAESKHGHTEGAPGAGHNKDENSQSSEPPTPKGNPHESHASPAASGPSAPTGDGSEEGESSPPGQGGQGEQGESGQPHGHAYGHGR